MHGLDTSNVSSRVESSRVEPSGIWAKLITVHHHFLIISCSYAYNPAPAGFAIINPAKSGSDRICKNQIRYSTNSNSVIKLLQLWTRYNSVIMFSMWDVSNSIQETDGQTDGRTNKRTNERTAGRRDASRLSVRPSVRLLDGVWHDMFNACF